MHFNQAAHGTVNLVSDIPIRLARVDVLAELGQSTNRFRILFGSYRRSTVPLARSR
jgi:hypothetical protein